MSRIVVGLSVVGRLIGVVGAALTVTVVAVASVEWLVLSYRHGPDWNFGILPLVFVLQVLLAVWVIWRTLRVEPSPLGYTFLPAFGVSFIFLYGWYFLLAGEGGELIGVGNLLYLAAGLIVLCTRLSSRPAARFEHNSP